MQAYYMIGVALVQIHISTKTTERFHIFRLATKLRTLHLLFDMELYL